MTLALGLLCVAAVAGALVWLRSRVHEVEERVMELRLMKRELDHRLAETAQGLQVTRAHLADVADGEAPERSAILSGKGWRDIQPAPALVLWEQVPDLVVLDVRTEPEWANGHIPRARLVPLD